MSSPHRNALTGLAVALAGLLIPAACSPDAGFRTPGVTEIPPLSSSTGMPGKIDLSQYVTDTNTESLTYEILSGGGAMTGSVYEQVFSGMGSHTIRFRVTNAHGKSAEASFSFEVRADDIAIIQSGNGLDILDLKTQMVHSIATNGAEPNIYRDRLPNGHLVYERQGSSGHALFVHDPQSQEAVQLGGQSGVDNRYENHTSDNRVLFTDGTAIETGLYIRNLVTQENKTIALSPGAHHRNAFVTSEDNVYFERDNGADSDIYFYQLGQSWPSAIYTSSQDETILAVLPDNSVIFSTAGTKGETDIKHARPGEDSFTIGGDLAASVQDEDMAYLGHDDSGLVIFQSQSASKDLHFWNPLTRLSETIATSSADEMFEALTGDGRVVYRVETSPTNHDLKIYNRSTVTTSDVAITSNNEIYQECLGAAGVVYLTETATGRDIYHYNITTNTSTVIAATGNDDYALAKALGNGKVVYTQSGATGGLYLYDPANPSPVVVAPAGRSFAGEVGTSDFAYHVQISAQTDLILWDDSEQKSVTISDASGNETFRIALDDGRTLFTRIVSGKTTADLFAWNADTLEVVRITDAPASVSVIAAHGKNID